MAIRYSDMGLDAIGARDFVARQRTPTMAQIAIIFISAFLIGVSIVVSVKNTMMLIATLFSLFGIIGWYVIYQLMRYRDMLLVTEFQNALFASAMGLHNKFCMIIKRDGTIVYLDRSFQGMFPDFVKQPVRNVDLLMQHGKVSRDDMSKVNEAIDKGTYEKVVFDISDAQGLIHRVILSVEPIMRPSGFTMLRGREFVGERTTDITPGGNVLNRSSMTLFSHVMESLKMGVYITSPTGVIVYCNPILEEWLGYQEGEIVARNLTLNNIIPIARNDNMSNEPIDVEGTVQMEKKVGGFIKAFLNQRMIYNDNGKLVGCTAVVHLYHDGEQPQATMPAEIKKKALTMPAASEPTRAAENILDQFIALSPIPMALLDRSGTLLFGNHAFHELTQHTLTSALPVYFETLFSKAKHDEMKAHLSHFSRGDVSSGTVQFELTLPNGQEMIISCYASEFSESHILLHLINITEQKQLELRFAHSQKMQAVGQLAGGVAHDFNNLLTAMIGFCDLLLMRHPAGDQSFADIMQIKQNANRAANLVRQLLAFSRRQTLQPKIIDLTDVLAELSNLVRRLIGENIELKMIHGRDISSIRADQGQLEQVLINLAVNARDAMKGGGTLTIRTSERIIPRGYILPSDMVAPSDEDKELPAGRYVQVEVADTGCGIPHNIIQKIFEPFFSTKEIGSGTGLGLATVYGIIKQTGGYLYVSSQENKGSTFSLFFPSVSSEEIAKTQASEQEAAQKETHQDLTGSCTILLVEDEMPVRTFAARALSNKGYKIIEADCAETALELMSDHGKDVEMIITDVIMPGMTGPAMIEKIMPQYPDIKVIFMSGYAEEAFVDNYGTDRDFNFLAKPFTLKQLAGKVKDVLG